MPNKKLSRVLLLILACASLVLAQTARRPFKIDDIARLRDVRDPQVSPDGQSPGTSASEVFTMPSSLKLESV